MARQNGLITQCEAVDVTVFIIRSPERALVISIHGAKVFDLEVVSVHDLPLFGCEAEAHHADLFILRRDGRDGVEVVTMAREVDPVEHEMVSRDGRGAAGDELAVVGRLGIQIDLVPAFAAVAEPVLAAGVDVADILRRVVEIADHGGLAVAGDAHDVALAGFIGVAVDVIVEDVVADGVDSVVAADIAGNVSDGARGEVNAEERGAVGFSLDEVAIFTTSKFFTCGRRSGGLCGGSG